MTLIAQSWPFEDANLVTFSTALKLSIVPPFGLIGVTSSLRS